MSKEPIALINSSIVVIEAAITLTVAFNFDLSDEQIAALMALVVAIGNLIKTFWTRAQVTPVSDPRDNQGRILKP